MRSPALCGRHTVSEQHEISASGLIFKESKIRPRLKKGFLFYLGQVPKTQRQSGIGEGIPALEAESWI